MILKDEVELLRRVPLFAGVEPTKLKLLAFTSDRMSFEAGQILFEQGDAGDAAYVVLNGSAEVLVNRAGSQIKVADLEKNAIVGEIAILCDVPRTATVRAHERLETLKISKDQFLRLLAEFPDMAIEIMRVLADRLGRTTAELSEARAQLSRRS
ncbi:MAG TPA: cyclic nucleotide-binding domain-containing protein [Aestuariivirgaceae bacterium]|jgi:CRP-like cAMP-binding protein|nr:cyclic nucleotide-binding domain-containing protein [Aestuariivirgaceae bacterium]